MTYGISDIVGDKRDALLQLTQRYGISNVRVFGSVARGEATSQSDIDLLVEGLETLPWGGGRLQIELQLLLGRQVDLVGEQDLHPLIRARVLTEAVAL
ncbi:MAG: nucleotidyltransferase family protein [Chloroflexota bacterium]|nr:nucleotidyltransferase family protein [Chloroflexota bacterium]